MFGHTASSLEAAFSDARDLACVEVFSGAGSIWRAFQGAGFAAASFDILDDPMQDVCMEKGFLALARLVLRLAPGGLLWVAPMCNSFSWLCMSTTGRDDFNGWAGNLANPNLVRGNHAALVSLFLMRLALGRGVDSIMENPAGSTLWKFLGEAWPFATYQIVTHRCFFEQPPLDGGMKLFKQYRLAGTAAWVTQLRRKCSCICRPRHRKAAKAVKDKNGKTATSGEHTVLRESGAYPAAMGIAVVEAWSRGSALAGSSAGSALAGSPALDSPSIPSGSAATAPSSNRSRSRSMSSSGLSMASSPALSVD